jgi:transposase InsO family protein
VSSIADDFLIIGCGDSVEEARIDHDNNLIALLNRCRESGLHLNKEKLQIDRQSTTFMGHELTKFGLRPDQQKIKAIVEMPPPADRPALMRLLGMAVFLAKFVPNFSEVTAKLRELLLKDVEFRWDDVTHGAALRKLKDMLVTAPVLQYYDVRKPVVIQSDASSMGLGACILQDGKPVEYASRSMTPTERDTYAQIEKELLAIVFATERFHTYVYGRQFTVETDHKPLTAIVKKSLASAPKRLQRMLLRLQRYNFTLVYRPGSQMLIADTLSRAPLAGGTPSDFAEEVAALADAEQQQSLRMVASEATIQFIRSAAASDEQYQLLRRQIASGWPDTAAALPPQLREYITFADELIDSDGLVFKGQRVVLPTEARSEILRRIHSSHIGVNGCIRRAKETVFYPGIIADIKKVVASCAVCSASQLSTQKEPLMSHAAPARPWEKLGVDICTIRQQDYLITVDYLSGYIEVDRLPSKRVSDVIYCLKVQFARHGLPLEVVSDNNPFNAAEFRHFAAAYDFKHTTSSPHYPQSNGRAEAAVKTIKSLFEKAMADREDPHLALLAWRNTPAEQLGLSPNQVLFGRRTRTHLPMTDALMSGTYDGTAREALSAAKQRQAAYYDRGARVRPTLAVGDTVRTRWNNNDEWEKAEVTRVLPHRSYLLRFENGSTRRRTSKHVRFSNEPPLIIRDEIDDGSAATQPLPQPPTRPPNSRNTGHTVNSGVARRAPENTMTATPTAAALVTRSGRQIKRPAKYADYVS